MSVRIVFELREVIRVVGAGDLAFATRFEEKEIHTARAAYDRAVAKAEQRIGTTQTFETARGSEITGRVLRWTVELIRAKTDGSRLWSTWVVGERKSGEVGLHRVFDAPPEARAS